MFYCGKINKKGTGFDFKDVTSKYALREPWCILSIPRKFDFRPLYSVSCVRIQLEAEMISK